MSPWLEPRSMIRGPTRPASPRTGLTFTLLSRSSPATTIFPDAGPAAATQRVYLNIEHADGQVVWLSSASVDTETGALTQATGWREGPNVGWLLDARRCEIQTHEASGPTSTAPVPT